MLRAINHFRGRPVKHQRHQYFLDEPTPEALFLSLKVAAIDHRFENLVTWF
jgi:hypothetical protein